MALVSVGVNVPDGNDVVGAVTLQRNSEGRLEATYHNINGFERVPHKKAAEVLRLIADAVELNGVQSPADFE